MQLSNTDFAALGEEAFLPKVKTNAKALFLYEEAVFGDIKLTAGGRNEHTTVGSAGDSPQQRALARPRNASFRPIVAL
ncbi:MAG: hypothetical protein IPP36_11445 [Nitrosomonadales bacterium]|nr:hypothetical protein [Nitrosomonadales bacterium]